MLTWLLITLLILAGWTGLMGWGAEHVENVCLQRNAVLMEGGREGPLQACR